MFIRIDVAAEPELKLRKLWLVIGYFLVLLVFYLSLTSLPVDPGLEIPFADKLYHAFAYFTLMAWFGQIYHVSYRRNIIAILFVCMGVLMEYLQSLNPARMFEYADMVANTVGVFIGILFVLSKAKNILLKFEDVVR